MAKSSSLNDSEPTVEAELSATTSAAGKGHATPTRKEREAANLRPLVSSDRKASNRSARAANTTARERARIGMANGEEKYLVAKDRGEQRRYIRDYVDARWSVGEMLIPIMLVVIITTYFQNPVMRVIGMVAIWGFLAIALIDSIVAALLIRRKLTEKFGASAVQKGNGLYVGMRAMQLRPMRLPKPQVKRRAYPV